MRKGEDEGEENNKNNQKETKWKKKNRLIRVARPGSFLFCSPCGQLSYFPQFPFLESPRNFLKSAHSTPILGF